MARTAGSPPPRSGAPTAFVALLRGVNVGGKNKLPMAALAAMFTDAGCKEVQTYIQSGNVAFVAKPAAAKKVPQLISSAIAESFGIRVPIVIRAADEVRQVAVKNPFLAPGADTGALFVGFLADLPDPLRVKALDPDRSPGDSYHVHGRDIYMRLSTGAANTRLTTAYFDSALATTSTFRNWRTVLKLVELTQS